MSGWEWVSIVLGTVQAVATVVAIYFAWRAVEVASETRREAVAEKQLARLERLRVAVGELERVKRWGGDSRKLEAVQDRVATLLRLSGGPNALPATAAIAHWHPQLAGAEDLIDAALVEIEAAIEKRQAPPT